MKSAHPSLLVAAGVLGLLGVGLGAFGAHGLKDTLAATGGAENWKTAVLYQFVHAVALVGLSQRPETSARRIGGCWMVGVILFSGSLYALSLGAPSRYLWPVTPLGGVFLLAGWALLTAAAWRGTKGS